MIQRGIGVAIGAIVSFILLILLTDVAMGDTNVILSLAIGAIAAWAWPVVIAFWLGRRAKQRRDGQIQGEVERQLDQERRGQG